MFLFYFFVSNFADCITMSTHPLVCTPICPPIHLPPCTHAHPHTCLPTHALAYMPTYTHTTCPHTHMPTCTHTTCPHTHTPTAHLPTHPLSLAHPLACLHSHVTCSGVTGARGSMTVMV